MITPTDRLTDFYRRLPMLTAAESVREALTFPYRCHDCGLPIPAPSGVSYLDELCDHCYGPHVGIAGDEER